MLNSILFYVIIHSGIKVKGEIKQMKKGDFIKKVVAVVVIASMLAGSAFTLIYYLIAK